jgi:hypothetical protein
LADSFAEELQRGYPAAHNPRRHIDDFQEAARAFAEKRQPGPFKGR